MVIAHVSHVTLRCYVASAAVLLYKIKMLCYVTNGGSGKSQAKEGLRDFPCQNYPETLNLEFKQTIYLFTYNIEMYRSIHPQKKAQVQWCSAGCTYLFVLSLV
jgi:hypothetical protein